MKGRLSLLQMYRCLDASHFWTSSDHFLNFQALSASIYPSVVWREVFVYSWGEDEAFWYKALFKNEFDGINWSHHTTELRGTLVTFTQSLTRRSLSYSWSHSQQASGAIYGRKVCSAIRGMSCMTCSSCTRVYTCGSLHRVFFFGIVFTAILHPFMTF